MVQIYGNLVVWVSSPPPDRSRVCVYDLATGTYHWPAGESGQCSHPQTDDSWVVWQTRRAGDSGGDFEIDCWDGTSVHQVTNNSYDDYFPQISNRQIVWKGMTPEIRRCSITGTVRPSN